MIAELVMTALARSKADIDVERWEMARQNYNYGYSMLNTLEFGVFGMDSPEKANLMPTRLVVEKYGDLVRKGKQIKKDFLWPQLASAYSDALKALWNFREIESKLSIDVKRETR